MDNQQSPFATPGAGDLSSGGKTYYPEIEYSAMKTPETYVPDVTPQKVATSRATFKLGFHYWDNEARERKAIDKFSFVVLEVYSSVSGYRETQPGQPGIKYFSNYVKNSSVEPFALFEKGIKRPIATGFYEGKKNGDTDFAKLVTPEVIENGVVTKPRSVVRIPDGAGFNQHFIVYWLEGDKIMDLKLSTMVSREVKIAISDAEKLAGRNVKPERVKTFALADGGAFWGFTVTKFKRVTKDGAEYDKKGEMFLVPGFVSGVVKTEGNGANPELHAKCAAMQAQIRAEYAAEVERRKKFGVATVTQQTAELQTASTAPNYGDESFPTEPPGNAQRYGGDAVGYETAAANPGGVDPYNTDDLPF